MNTVRGNEVRVRVHVEEDFIHLVLPELGRIGAGIHGLTCENGQCQFEALAIQSTLTRFSAWLHKATDGRGKLEVDVPPPKSGFGI